MLALLSGGPKLITPPPFTSSQSVTIPLGVSNLVSLIGKGQDGSPQIALPVNGYNKTTTSYYYTASTGQTATLGTSTVFVESDFVPTPETYCDLPTTYPNGDQFYNCYTRVFATGTHTYPPSNGLSTTGFGQTFPGGTGGPASSVTMLNVPVTGGASYSLVIPGGGSITISYYL